MNEAGVRSFLARIGVERAGRRTAKGWVNGPCPLSQWRHRSGLDRHPSFGVAVSDHGRSIFKCYTCKSQGSLAELVRMLGVYRQQNLSAFADEIEQAEVMGFVAPDFDAPRVSVAPMIPIDEALADGLFDTVATPPAAEYLRSRGIPLQVAEGLGVSFDPEKKRIVFEVRDRHGKLYGWTGRSIIPNHTPKVLDYMGLPKERLILGAHRWRAGWPVALVEGLFAYLHFHALELEQGEINIGALLGSEMTEAKADILREHGEPAYLFVDPDEAGETCLFGRLLPPDPNMPDASPERDFWTGAIGKLYGHVPVIAPEYPEAVNDPDNLTREHVDQMMTTLAYVPTPWQMRQRNKPQRKSKHGR